MRTLFHIVPTLDAEIDAIRDYAGRLASGLAEAGISSIAIGTGASATARRGFEDVLGVAAGKSEDLAKLLADAGADSVLLHACGYGYARRGAPFWLVQGLRGWKAGSADRRLGVMFHELWAFGPVWRSSFWTSPAQRLVVRQLARLADVMLTSSALYASRLRQLSGGREIAGVAPVLSNLGEPANVPSYAERAPAAIVFGQSGHRHRVYGCLDRFLPMLRACGIGRIVDVGPSLPAAILNRLPLPVEPKGFVPVEEASALMRQARIGLQSYPLDCLAKSGIFAAYAAHGVVPLVDGERDGSADGLEHGRNLIQVGRGGLSANQIEACSSAVLAWYRRHDLAATARMFSRALFPHAS